MRKRPQPARRWLVNIVKRRIVRMVQSVTRRMQRDARLYRARWEQATQPFHRSNYPLWSAHVPPDGMTAAEITLFLSYATGEGK